MYSLDFCCYCGEKIKLIELTNEHLVPISKGGNNSLLNKRPCCQPCNTMRGDLDYAKWLQKLRFMRSRTYKTKLSKYKLEAMIENVQYWQHYVNTAKERLYKKSYLTTYNWLHIA